MTAPVPALTTLSRTFRDGTEELARELCDVCRPLLPPAHRRLFRTDQLDLVAGLEGERPLIAAALALAPAVSAAGDAICIAALAGGESTTAVLTAVQPVAEIAAEALRLVRRPHRMAEVLVFAHQLALTAHRGADLLTITERPWLPRGPRETGGLWGLLLDGLEGRLRRARELAAGDETGEWRILADTAAACRDGAVHAMHGYDGLALRSARRPRSRLLRSLAFANLYCGFAVLRDVPGGGGPPGHGTARHAWRRWRISPPRRRGEVEAPGRSAPGSSR